MKRKSLFKSLLVAAGLLVGGSAWADLTQGTTTTVDFNGQTTPFTIYQTTRLGVSYVLHEGSTTDYYANYTCGNRNALPFASYDFSSAVAKAEKVVISFDYQIPSGIAGSAYIAIADKDIHNSTNGGYNISSKSSVWGNNGVILAIGNNRASGSNFPAVNGVNKGSALSFATWYTATVTVNVNAKTVSYTIKAKGNDAIVDSGTDMNYWNTSDGTTANTCNQIDISMANTGSIYIDNISITPYTNESEKYAGYTIRYMCGETELKASVTDRAEVKVGETAILLAEDKAAIMKDNKKYIYESDDASTQTIKEDGSTVITVFFKEANKYTCTLNAVDSNNNLLLELGTAEQYEGDDATIYFHKAIYVNNKWYITTYTGNWVFHEAKTENILFTEDATMSYFFEVEDINKSRDWAAGGAYPDRYSNGKAGRLYKAAYAYTDALEGGVYSVTLWGRNQASSSEASIGLYVRDSGGNETKCGSQFENWAKGGGQGEHTVMVNIPDGYSLELKNESDEWNSNLEMDYLILRKSEINSMSIVGFTVEADLTDADKWNPANGIAMTREADNPAIWKAVVTDYVISGSDDASLKYYYKAVANEQYGVYELPASGNQEYNFNYAEAGAGTYTLTFTANTLAHTVELAILKLDENTYTVAGSEIFGSMWDPTDTNNDMTRQSDNSFTWTKKDVELAANTTIEYKVVKNHSWSEAYPSDNAKIEIKDKGTYDITITYLNGTVSHAIAIQKAITDAGYATFCSSYALDLSNVSGLTAYEATISGNTVTFVDVNDPDAGAADKLFAAKEGMLLMGAEGTYSIPVIASAPENVDNMLIGVLEETTITETGIFVLLNTNNKVGFYKTTKAFTLGANSAYLPVHSTARDYIWFGGEDTTTSIEAISNKTINGDVYNLNGQRVVAPQKGLYIVNGKKVVLK